jgi:hypothetical protein
LNGYPAPMQYHSRDPALLAWLATFTPAEEYVTRCALLRLFRSFQNDWEFKAATETLRSRINPSEAELSQLWKLARERAEMIEQTLARLP